MTTLALLAVAVAQNPVRVPSNQLIQPGGPSLELAARPVDFVAGRDGTIYVKANGAVLVIRDRKVVQRLPVPGGTSHFGIVLSKDGRSLFVSDAASTVHIADTTLSPLAFTATAKLPKPTIGGETYPVGLAVMPDGSVAVAASRSNSVIIAQAPAYDKFVTIPVDAAPYGVALSPDGQRLLVSCWSVLPGRRGATAPSAGTNVPVRANGIGTRGSLVTVDLQARKVVSRVPLRLQPTEIAVAPEGNAAYVAEANGDAVAVVDYVRGRLLRRLSTSLKGEPTGSAPNGLSLSRDGRRLYVALGGANQVLVYRREKNREVLEGRAPTGWYPGTVREVDGTPVVAAIKGYGQGKAEDPAKGFNVYQFSGLLTWLEKPPTAKADETWRYAMIRSARKVAPSPVPERLGEPSVFEHVFYVLKENRTYDQVFGDMGRGASDPRLCIYGRNVTPNHHALADEFVLMDNYYCNGVNSADGHAWSMEANATTYFERSFGGWTRSYPFGDDPLSVTESGYIWDAILKAGRSFRNYGEFDYAEPVPKGAPWTAVYREFLAGKINLTHNIGVAKLRKYSHPQYPGWNMNIPDVLRADIFLKEFRQLEQKGKPANFNIVYLPQDHTVGTSAGAPTPRAHVADNDLALGRIVDAISHSRFWSKSVIFVIEDDPQDGFDHVDGHRSLCLVVSPYTKRRSLNSSFHNQTSALHTMFRILGVQPTTRYMAESTVMSDVFTSRADLTPYRVRPNQVPLDELNPSPQTLNGLMKRLALASAKLDLKRPDNIEDDQLNRILWHAAKGPNVPYPAAYAGAHGKGLKQRGLKTTKVEDDD